MPTVQLCDGGCGAVEGDGVAFVELGKIRTKRYCHACEAPVLMVVKLSDELHTQLASDWTAGIGELRDSFHKEHPKAVLPDE